MAMPDVHHTDPAGEVDELPALHVGDGRVLALAAKAGEELRPLGRASALRLAISALFMLHLVVAERAPSCGFVIEKVRRPGVVFPRRFVSLGPRQSWVKNRFQAEKL
jgi:hypothetical protein